MARKPMGKHRQRELRTVLLMIALYEKHHPPLEEHRDRYQRLSAYATNRLERCHFGEDKPACKHCPIHCYQSARREEIKAIMRWSGPRMLLHHPILAIRHLIDDHRPVPEHTPKRGATAPEHEIDVPLSPIEALNGGGPINAFENPLENLTAKK